jgi:hypothetical protein
VEVYSYKNLSGINYFRNFLTAICTGILPICCVINLKLAKKKLSLLICNHRNQSTIREVLIKVIMDFNVVDLRRVILGPCRWRWQAPFTHL